LRGLLARGEREIVLLAELLSLPGPAADLNLSPQRKREMLFEAELHQLEALARHRPVLMVFEDAHWIDPTSRELLDLTIERVRSLPVLLIVQPARALRAPLCGSNCAAASAIAERATDPRPALPRRPRRW
jgi:predicted ATPase